MADFRPPDGHLNGVGVAALAGPDRLGGVASSETVGSKRQRRPSVRLGEIGGDQFYETQHRRTNSNKQWKHHQILTIDGKKDHSKSSKTRPLTNLATGGDFVETLGDEKEGNLDSVAVGSWKVRDLKKGFSNATTKRVRSNWVTKTDDTEEKYEDMDNSYHMENSESPINSQENLGDGNERNEREMYYNRRSIRVRDNGVELSGPSETDLREYRSGIGEDGVRIWLNSIGLGRYAAVFEIHEVDDEVLPLLTLEDLKDMGINAVGSRRKMFCAIQKLGKGFS